MSSDNFSIKVGGAAGQGVFTVGLLLSKFFQNLGLEVSYTTDYPSLIKGGHNTCCVRCSPKRIYGEELKCDILVACDENTLKVDAGSVKEGGIVVCDEKYSFESEKLKIVKVPTSSLLEGFDVRYKNTLLFGIIVGLLHSEKEVISQSIKSHFLKKDESVQKANIDVALKGFGFACGLGRNSLSLPKSEHKGTCKNLFISGNDAAALGSLKAGVKFVAEYPMTPSSSFLSFFASCELSYNITTKHAEDELAAINMVVGASVAGVRTMSATSGGGFSLMCETLGFAGIAENPIVIFECMRAGPSTGMPTFTDQGDLKFVLNASQGEFPLIVLAPGCPEECFYKSFEAFNLADITQTPVVVLLDKHIGTTQITTPRFKTEHLKINRGDYVSYENRKKSIENYKRYEFTETGISKRVCLGHVGCNYVNSSYEHDETSWTSEDAENHRKMHEKRFKKLETIPKEMLRPKIYGDENADITLVGWGSTKLAVLDAISELKDKGFSVNYIHFIYINPMDIEYVSDLLKRYKKLLILEGNFTAQFRDVLREKTGVYIEEVYLKYDGRPFFYEDIVEKVVEVIGK